MQGPARNLPKFVCAFAKFCDDVSARGWHEANGGNLSYRLTSDDLDELTASCSTSPGQWVRLTAPMSRLANEHILISASGAHLCNLANDISSNSGIMEIDDKGASWRVIWGFTEGAEPSSEIETHLAIYAQELESSKDLFRVVYHAHSPHIIALSAIIPALSREWTRMLWQYMTEGIVAFPEGVAVLPWMAPGSPELADHTGVQLRTHRACVWAHHGMIVRESSFDNAFGLVDTIEKIAGIYLEARAACGGKDPAFFVDDNQLRAICERYNLKLNDDYLE